MCFDRIRSIIQEKSLLVINSRIIMKTWVNQVLNLSPYHHLRSPLSIPVKVLTLPQKSWWHVKIKQPSKCTLFFFAFFNFTKNGQESKFSMENGVQTPLISIMKNEEKKNNSLIVWYLRGFFQRIISKNTPSPHFQKYPPLPSKKIRRILKTFVL